MKTKLLPLVLLALAISGAVISNAYSKANIRAHVLGYIDHPVPCTIAIDCSDIVGPVCRDADSNQAFGKFNPTDTECTKVVYRPLP